MAMDSKDLDLAGLLAQINGDGSLAEQHIDQIAHHATPDALAQGIAETFRSDQTPPMPEMVASLFGNSRAHCWQNGVPQVEHCAFARRWQFKH